LPRDEVPAQARHAGNPPRSGAILGQTSASFYSDPELRRSVLGRDSWLRQ